MSHRDAKRQRVEAAISAALGKAWPHKPCEGTLLVWELEWLYGTARWEVAVIYSSERGMRLRTITEGDSRDDIGGADLRNFILAIQQAQIGILAGEVAMKGKAK